MTDQTIIKIDLTTEPDADDNADWLKLIPGEQQADLAAGEQARMMLQLTSKELHLTVKHIILKHMAGRHNQKRHGWRYGGGAGGSRDARLAAARASMHRTPELPERTEYRRRAGMPETPVKISKKPEPAPKPIPTPAPAPALTPKPLLPPKPPKAVRAPKPKPVKPPKPPKPDSAYAEMSPDDSYDSHASFHGDPAWQTWLHSLTPREQEAISEWVGKPGVHGVYRELNKALRNGTFDAAAHPHSTITKTYRGMDSAIEKGRLHKDMVLWRSMDLSSLYRGASDGSIRPGDVLPDKAFVATSPKRGTATGWYFMSGLYPVLWRIKAPKGSRGAYLSWDELRNPYMHEAEFVLPRNSRFRVDGVSFKTVDGKRSAYYDLTLLGEGE